jgi:hypothetical protein
MLPARLIRALDTLCVNKGIKYRVMQLSAASTKLNDIISARSNNSFNASGISLDVIRENWMLLAILPAALIRALGVAGCRIPVKL